MPFKYINKYCQYAVESTFAVNHLSWEESPKDFSGNGAKKCDGCRLPWPFLPCLYATF